MEDKYILKQLKKIDKIEYKMARENDLFGIKNKIAGISDKVSDNIPEKLKENLELAFYKGFKMVFEKGTGIIEKSFDKEKVNIEHEVYNYLIDKNQNVKNLRVLNKKTKGKINKNMAITMAEGTGLGILGIGLPDIPIFIGVILKGIYETAVSYGFEYKSDVEKYYILKVIESSMSTGKKRVELDIEITRIGNLIDREEIPEFDLEKQIQITSGMLSEGVLTAKFIQGLAIIGAVGGVVNVIVYKKISDYAYIKYQKRYLIKKKTKITC